MSLKNLTLLFCILFFVACGKDDTDGDDKTNESICNEANCIEGSCVDGDCICSQGYEGLNCDIPITEKFEGTWTLDYLCKEILEKDQEGSTNLVISKGPNINQITFNLHSLDLIANIEESKKFTIIPQKIEIITISGYGSIDTNGDLNLVTNQYVIEGTPLITCAFSGTK